jgi:YgiT-type zinc finger domain-containing protein
MMLKRTINTPGFACFECQTGVMKVKFVTYFTWIETQLITVPDFPAWVCDVCGNSVYDQKAVNVITTLLNPSTGRPAHTQKVKPGSNMDTNSVQTVENQN